MMKISFVVPAYNEELIIEACLRSIMRELKEAPCSAEIVVVNNASTDRTKEIADSLPGVRVVDEPQKGLVFARKAGFEATTGELVANIDADTIVPTGWLMKVCKEFANDDRLVALTGPFLYYDISPFSRLLVQMYYGVGYLSQLLGIGVMLQGGNFVIKREALQSVGGFDTSIVFYGEDSDIGRRLKKAGKVKWTFALPIYSSGRRFKGEGMFMASVRYGMNYVSITLRGKPYSVQYRDIRLSDTHHD